MTIRNVRPTVISVALAFSMCGAPASGAEFSAIHDFWSNERDGCVGSDDFWQIKASGASKMEEACKVSSATRKGNRYILKQSCAVEGTKKRRTDTFRLLSPKILEADGRRYARCPDPYNGET